MLFWLFTVYALGWCMVQADYDILLEDIDCSQINEEYVKSCDLELNYDSTYGASLNVYIELIKTLPEDTKVVRKVSLFRKRVFLQQCTFMHNRDTKSVKCRDVYLNRTKWIATADVFTVRMGEYTVDLGLHIDASICEIVADSKSRMLKAIDMDSDNCPPDPGVYQLEDYVIDSMDGLPPSLPDGHYLFNMTLTSKDTTIGHIDVYIRIY